MHWSRMLERGPWQDSASVFLVFGDLCWIWWLIHHMSRLFQSTAISYIIHQTHYEKSDWSRAFNQFTIACEPNICCRYCIYHVKFNVCLVTKPLGVLRNKMAERFASVSEDELCEKCIIKQLLNSVFAWYHELSKPRVCVICLNLRLRQILTQTSVLIIHDIMLNLIQ